MLKKKVENKENEPVTKHLHKGTLLAIPTELKVNPLIRVHC